MESSGEIGALPEELKAIGCRSSLIICVVTDGERLSSPLVISTEAIGKVKINRDPTPTVDSTVISPPCNSTSCFVIDNPNPVPPYSRAVEPSACSNDSKMRSNLSSEIPIPVSETVIAKYPGCSGVFVTDSRNCADTSMTPIEVNLIPLAIKFCKICWTRFSSANTNGTSAGMPLINCKFLSPIKG